MCFLFFRALRAKPAVKAAIANEPETQETDAGAELQTDAGAELQADAGAELQAEAEVLPAPAPPPRISRPPKPRNTELQRILDRGNGLPIGVAAPDFVLPNLAGQRISLHSLGEHGKTIGLVFISPHCDSCRALAPYIRRWAREHSQALTFAVISRGTPAQNLDKLRGLDPSRILLQNQFELSDSYGVRSTPAVVLIGTDGRIQSQIAVGRDDIARLIATTFGEPMPFIGT